MQRALASGAKQPVKGAVVKGMFRILGSEENSCECTSGNAISLPKAIRIMFFPDLIRECKR